MLFVVPSIAPSDYFENLSLRGKNLSIISKKDIITISMEVVRLFL